MIGVRLLLSRPSAVVLIVGSALGLASSALAALAVVGSSADFQFTNITILGLSLVTTSITMAALRHHVVRSGAQMAASDPLNRSTGSDGR
jgi:hypothetical protein